MIKPPIFFSKKPVSGNKNHECFKDYLGKKWPTAGFEPSKIGFLTLLTSHTFVLYKTSTTPMRTQSLRHGQNQEKKKIPTAELKYFLSKIFFSIKINNVI